MSPNCWRAIEDAVAARAPCRYLEWGSGNSTIALLRAALENRGGPRLELHSIESDLDFARSMFDAIAETFQRASVDGLVRVEPLRYPKPSLLEALGSDPAVARYEAQFLKVLWYTRNDRFWVMNSEPRAGDLGRWGGLRRYGTTLRCSAAFRLQRVRRALAPTDMTETETAVGTVQSPPKPPLRSPTLVTFDTEPVLAPVPRDPSAPESALARGADPRRAVRGVRRLRLGTAGRTVRRGSRRRSRANVVPQAGSSRPPPRARWCALPARRAPAIAAGGVAALQHMVLRAGTRSVPEEDSPGGEEGPTPPQVRSGASMQDVEAVSTGSCTSTSRRSRTTRPVKLAPVRKAGGGRRTARSPGSAGDPMSAEPEAGPAPAPSAAVPAS